MGLDSTPTFTFVAGLAGALVSETAQAYLAVSSSGKLPARYKTVGFWIVTIAMAPLAAGFVVAYGTTNLATAFIMGAAVPLFIRSFAMRTASRQAEEEAAEKVEQATKAVEETPEKVRPYWDLSSARLELYFQRNLSQTGSIFWITVVVLLAGFGLICYGVARAFNGGQLEAAALTAGAGVITEFIAATFLVIYRSTLAQASNFVLALERINAVGMSLQVVDSIKSADGDLRDKTLAALAMKIMDVYAATREKPSEQRKKKSAAPE